MHQVNFSLAKQHLKAVLKLNCWNEGEEEEEEEAVVLRYKAGEQDGKQVESWIVEWRNAWIVVMKPWIVDEWIVVSGEIHGW